jgi:protocatechuate 3,4-dioxygenase beta subunit
MNFNGTTFLVTVSSSYVHTGDTMTVTVTITDENGDPVEDASVELYKETTE